LKQTAAPSAENRSNRTSQSYQMLWRTGSFCQK